MASSNETYTANGAEGTALTRSVLIGMTVLLCFQGDYLLKEVASAPAVGQFTFDDATGTLTFGVELQPDQVVQVIYK